MKRIFVIALILISCCSAVCFGTDKKGKIVIGASTTPHAEILKAAVPLVRAKGYELVIKEFDDYVQPNLALANGGLDANYFQHKPYLDNFCTERNLDLISIGAIHYEPLGIHPGKTKTISALKQKAKIAVPNDTTNEARALLLLEANGIIKINKKAGLNATVKDIIENPMHVKIIELEAAQLARSLRDVDLAVINGNYAIKAGLNIQADAIAKEERDSLAAKTFGNVIAIRKCDINRTDIKVLMDCLMSEEIKDFINKEYNGAVVPIF